MLRQPAKALLIDLDGVVRRWDASVAAGVESSYGLTPGILAQTAFSWDLLRSAVAGEITDAEWMYLIAKRLPLDEEQAQQAVAEWQQHRGTVDPDVLSFVRQVRAAGRPVGLAANATDRLRGDLDELGLTNEFDAIISSTELKVHKPAPEFFAQACEMMGLQAPWVLFVDDDDRVVRGARAAKLLAFRWAGTDGVTYLSKALALG